MDLPQDVPPELTTIRRWMAAGSGLYLTLGALGVAALAWIVLHLVATMARKGEMDLGDLPGIATQGILHPPLGALAAIPALAVGVWLLATRRRALLWSVAGTLLLLIPAAYALVVFMLVVGRLYRYESI